MNSHMIDERRFSGIAESLYYDFDKVKDLYPYDFSRPEYWVSRVAWLDSHPGADPVRVSEALMTLNLRLGGSEKTLDNVRILAEEPCLSVVTGQQAGLFTGPLYTLYKAVTAIKQAKTLSRVTGRPVVPIFWMATEDHDFQEIAMNWNFDGCRVKRVRLSRKHRHNVPVGNLPVSDELVSLCGDLCADLGTGESAREMAELLSRTLEESSTLGEWFGRLLLQLFAPWGLVVLDPAMPEMRAVMKPYFLKTLLDTLSIQQAFKHGTQLVTSLGFRPEMSMGEGQTGIFLIDEGIRIPLYSDAEGISFSDRNGTRHWNREELLARLEARPEEFSCGAVLRPAAQDWLLPVAAAVLGPSEAAYHGQLGEVFAIMGRQLPAIVPRESWILTPEADAAAMADIRELNKKTPEDWLSNRIMDSADDTMRSRITQLANDHQTQLRHFIDTLPLSSGTRDMLAVRAATMQEREIKWLLKQIRKFLVVEADEMHTYHCFARMIKPLGKAQERTLLPWYFLSRFGRGLLTDLIELEFSMDLRIHTGGKTS